MITIGVAVGDVVIEVYRAGERAKDGKRFDSEQNRCRIQQPSAKQQPCEEQ
jgi:hypothetical protein